MGQRTHFHSGLRAKDHESFLSELKVYRFLADSYLLLESQQRLRKEPIFNDLKSI